MSAAVPFGTTHLTCQATPPDRTAFWQCQALTQSSEIQKAQLGFMPGTVVLIIYHPQVWFWTANDGKVYISLRYGTKVIEIAKSKSAIEVGERRQLVPVIEALKQTVAAGEVDQQLAAASTEIEKRFLKPF